MVRVKPLYRLERLKVYVFYLCIKKMSTVNTLAQSVSKIANRVNAHQILLEDLRTKFVSPSTQTSSSPTNSVEPSIESQIETIYKTIEDKMANLETEMKQMVNRQTKMLESTLKHEISQKVSSAVSDFDKSGTICIIQQRLETLDSRVEALCRLCAYPNTHSSTDDTVTSVETNDSGLEMNVSGSEALYEETVETVAKPKVTRRRAKPVAQEKAVLSLE